MGMGSEKVILRGKKKRKDCKGPTNMTKDFQP